MGPPAMKIPEAAMPYTLLFVSLRVERSGASSKQIHLLLLPALCDLLDMAWLGDWLGFRHFEDNGWSRVY